MVSEIVEAHNFKTKKFLKNVVKFCKLKAKAHFCKCGIVSTKYNVKSLTIFSEAYFPENIIYCRLQ